MTEREGWERDISPSSEGDDDEASDDASVVRHEEELQLGKETQEVGRVRVHKHVDTYPVEKIVPREIESADFGETTAPNVNDSGEIETLPDGSVSIPLFEEELVVTKRLVVRERVIVRKRTVVDEHRVEAELRKERVEVDVDESVRDVVQNGEG